MKQKISKGMFIFLILGEIFEMATVPSRPDYEVADTAIHWLGFNFSLFDSGFGLVLILLVPGYLRKFSQENGPNRNVLLIVLLQVLYQVIVVVPLSVMQDRHGLNDVIRLLAPRLYMLLIPFLYWYVLPAYKETTSSYRLIRFSAIALVIAGFLRYGTGNFLYTNTGEVRFLWGGTALVFALVLVTSLHYFSKFPTNYFYSIVAAVGLVMANHRSAYIAMFFLALTSLFLGLRQRSRFRVYLGTLSLLFAALLLVWQVPVLRENFFSRFATTADLSDPNAEFRFGTWALATSHFLDYPVNGSLLKNQFYDSSVPLEYPPHNWIFEVLATQGAVGFLFYATIFYLLLKLALKNKNDPVSWQMFLAVTFYLVFCLANANFLIKWNIVLLAYPCAVIMYRDKVLGGSQAGAHLLSA